VNRFLAAVTFTAFLLVPGVVRADDKELVVTQFKLNKEKQTLELVTEKGENVSLSIKDGFKVIDSKGNSFILDKYAGIITWPPGKKGPGSVKVSVTGTALKILDDRLVVEAFRPKDGEKEVLRIRDAGSKD